MQKADFISLARSHREQYTPSGNVANQLAQVDLLAIVGPTGAGKTTLMNKLNIPFVVSDVTRKQRPSEIGGQNYRFRTDYDQLAREIESGEFVQYVINDTGEFYGTHSSAYPQSGWCMMAIIAVAIEQFRRLGFRNVRNIYIVPPNFEEWMRRVQAVSADNIAGRLKEAATSLEIALQDPSYIFVVNDDIDRALTEIERIVAGEILDSGQMLFARETAASLLQYLK